MVNIVKDLRNGKELFPDDKVNPWTALAALAVKKWMKNRKSSPFEKKQPLKFLKFFKNCEKFKKILNYEKF